MSVCPKCFTDQHENGKFCANCGAALKGRYPGSTTREFAHVDETDLVSSVDHSPHGRFLPGTKISDRYRIVSLVGRGGMGEVYRADDLKLGQTVALKFLPTSLASDPDRLKRFHSEVRLTRKISHPNVCRVYDIGEASGQPFLSMEYVDGEDLRVLIRRIGPLPLNKGLEVAYQLCSGLAAAHDNGVIHRDLKPANIMLDGRGQVRITDFGLATATSFNDLAEVVGTPCYMAPEQLSRGQANAASDLYSLGLTLYEVFTGNQFFRPASRQELLQVHDDFKSSRPRSFALDIDDSVRPAVQRCLEYQPDERPKSAMAVAAMLPGSDRLEAVLATGEMPLPELVAAAGDKQGMSPRSAAVILTAILIGLCVLGFLSNRIQEMMGIDIKGLIRINDAERIINELGYQQNPVDLAWGLKWNTDYFRYFVRNAEASLEWTRLAGTPPRPTVFWYRQSANNLVPWQGRGPYSSMFVTQDDPPAAAPGMCNLVLDSDGKLLEWRAVPLPNHQIQSVGESDAWRNTLLVAAGFDSRQFEQDFVRNPEQERSRPPPVFADDWSVWQSTSTSTVIEAAALRGQPVYFRVAPEQHTPAPLSSGIRPFILALTILALFGTAIFLGHRNWKSGNADRRGARRLFLFVMVTSLIYWSCQAHHVIGPGELVMILETVARATLRGILICAAYIGLEPYVRKAWPRVLVGWNRLLANGLFDGRVGRDVVIGIAGGVVAQMIGSLPIVFGIPRQFALTADPFARLGEGPFPLEPLIGFHFAVGQVDRELFVGLVGGFFACLVFVFALNLVVRNRWLAASLVVLFFSFPSISNGDVPGAVIVALWVSLGLGMLFRFGVLTVVVGWVSWQIVSWPIGFSFSTPYVDIGALGYAFVFLAAVLGAYWACTFNKMRISGVTGH